VQESFYIFQELCEKYTWTVMLMNGSAVCQMHMGHFDEAESRLLEALNKVHNTRNYCAYSCHRVPGFRFFPADHLERLLLNNHNFQVTSFGWNFGVLSQVFMVQYLTVAVGLLGLIFSMMKWSLFCRIRRTPTHLLI